MASKNHKRYKTRRQNALHATPSLFAEPPILVKGWNDLAKLQSDKYEIVVEDSCCAHVRPKFEINDEDFWEHHKYLSTHTFYGHCYMHSTITLRRLGFNVQLENWDGETIYAKR